ncbi:MAG: helix-turn-helix transcriptional regulator [Actinophytocola sp.]|uniref:helix-turn-helix domain-containing protein n=1 Tax=Actinophytocola sp. TaxID=1872138 RepID=UPI003C76812E
MTKDDPVIAQIQLGILLRDLRDRKGLTAAEAGKYIGTSYASISRIENGKQGIAAESVGVLCEVYGANDAESAEALRLAAQPKSRVASRRTSSYRDAIPNSFRRYLALEADASDIMGYDELVITGLLQTEHYARTLVQGGSPLASRTDIDRQVQTRMSRQELLRRTDPAAPQLELIEHEAALHRVIGDDAVMRGQLNHMLDLAELPNVELRILPFRPKQTRDKDEAFTAQTSFRLLKLPERGTIVYLEDFASSTYPEDVQVIQRYASAFQRLRAVAADPDESRALIAKVAQQHR